MMFDSAAPRASAVPHQHGSHLPPRPVPHGELADLVVASIERLGVEHVFGVAGRALDPLYDALTRSARRGGLQHVLARTEAAAVRMAEGYARARGRPAVCLATGAGAVHLLPAVAGAHADGVPLLIITVEPAGAASAEPAMAALDLLRPCTRYNDSVPHPRLFEPRLAAAIDHAIGALADARPGPVHLSVPAAVLRQPVRMAASEGRARVPAAAAPDRHGMQALRTRLERARQPVLLIGAGAAGAVPLILQLAQLHGGAVVTTAAGKGLVSPQHPLYRGVVGPHGHAGAHALLADPDTDLVLAIGTRMSDWLGGARAPARLGQLVLLDGHAAAAVPAQPASLHVAGALPLVFAQLCQGAAAGPGDGPLPGPSAGPDTGHLTTRTPHLAGTVPSATPVRAGTAGPAADTAPPDTAPRCAGTVPAAAPARLPAVAPAGARAEHVAYRSAACAPDLPAQGAGVPAAPCAGTAGVGHRPPPTDTAARSPLLDRRHGGRAGALHSSGASAAPLQPRAVMTELSTMFPPTTRFLADTGDSAAWATLHLAPPDRRRAERRRAHRLPAPDRRALHGWLQVAPPGAPAGWAIAAAVGAALAHPALPVLCIASDGALALHGHELALAVAEGLNVIVVVLNEGGHGMERCGQRPGCTLPPIDAAAFARAFGACALTVQSAADLRALDAGELLGRAGPTVLDVAIVPAALPPTEPVALH